MSAWTVSGGTECGCGGGGQLVQRLKMVLQLEVGRRLGIAQVTNQQIHGFHRIL